MPPGQKVALQPGLTGMFAQDLKYAPGAVDVVVLSIERPGKLSVSNLEDCA